MMHQLKANQVNRQTKVRGNHDTQNQKKQKDTDLRKKIKRTLRRKKKRRRICYRRLHSENLDRRKMSKKKNVKVRSFPGATTSNMTDFVKPTDVRKRPESVILHVGTSDLKSNSEAHIADDIIELANSIRNQQINCAISPLTYRKGNVWNSGETINEIVKRKSEELGIRIIKYDNINSSHLNNSGLHLTKRGTIC